jgi:hypothetical protein
MIRNSHNFESAAMKKLHDPKLEELLKQTNSLQSTEMYKYIDLIRNFEAENEYNRTEIDDHNPKQSAALEAIKKINGIRIIEKIDSECHSKSYLSKSKKHNQTRISKAMHGLNKMQDICYLQVRGKNQL